MRLILVAAVFLFSLVQPGPTLAQGNAEAGKKLWESVDARCRDCHGTQGEGAFGPDLAGRQLSIGQFTRAVRTPWGVMPTFPETQYSDQDLVNFYTYLSGLPKVAQPGPWRIQIPAGAPLGQQVLIGTIGCGQCHGPTMQGPRAQAGAVGADFEWFKRMTYEHTTFMPEHRKVLGDAPTGVRMGNFSRTRVPESLLEEIWKFLRDDAKFRARIVSRLTAGTPAGTYNVNVQNASVIGKGLTPEDLTIVLALSPGTKVANATGAGYKGVRTDPQLSAEVAVWQLPRLAPKEQQTYTITLGSGGAITSGLVRWTKPTQGLGAPDQALVAMPPPPATR